jgi:hypothetical protein
MTAARILYLILAVAGAILPMVYFVRWFDENGWSPGGMVAAWNVNDAATGLVWDLTIAALALTVFVIAECVVRRDRLSLVAIPATYLVGLSCGLPLYLFLRSRPRD